MELHLPELGTGGEKLARSRKSAKRRDAIMRAAIEIINAKSYAFATMTEIAAALDLRDAALYYYFQSKQALAYQCHRRSLACYERLLDEAEKTEGGGAGKLEAFLFGMMDDAARNGPQLYFGDYSYLEAPERDVIAAWAKRLTDRIEQFLKQGIEDGSIVPCETELVVQLLVGMLVWLAKWAPSVEGMTVGRLMRAINAFSLHGLESRSQQSSTDTVGTYQIPESAVAAPRAGIDRNTHPQRR